MPFPRNFNLHAALARRPRSAFTLVELLVVIAILAILVALAFPLVRNSIAAGDRAACVHNLKALSAGVMLYAADNNGEIPIDGKAFRLTLQPYIRGASGGLMDHNEILSYYHCRAALRARSVSLREPTVTYGYNGSLGYPNASPPRRMRMIEMSHPAKTMMIMDGRKSPTIWFFEVGPGNQRRLQPDDFVHGGKVNAAYADGHVAALGPDDLPADKNDVFWNPKGVVP